MIHINPLVLFTLLLTPAFTLGQLQQSIGLNSAARALRNRAATNAPAVNVPKVVPNVLLAELQKRDLAAQCAEQGYECLQPESSIRISRIPSSTIKPAIRTRALREAQARNFARQSPVLPRHAEQYFLEPANAMQGIVQSSHGPDRVKTWPSSYTQPQANLRFQTRPKTNKPPHKHSIRPRKPDADAFVLME